MATTTTAVGTWKRCDGSAVGVDAVLSALREIEADSTHAVLTTVDPHTGRPVSRAVRVCDHLASGSDFSTVRIVSRADTRKVYHASASGATACVPISPQGATRVLH
nr:hypothetical protein [Pandoravirus massiliensis]